MTIYFVAGYRIMDLLMMEIVEKTGGIVVEGRDSWWLSLIVKRVSSHCCWWRQLDDQCPGCAVLWFNRGVGQCGVKC